MKSNKTKDFNPNTEKNRKLLISAIQGDEKSCDKLRYILRINSESMKSKKAEEYLNRIYEPGSKSMKDKVYSREMANKAIRIAKGEIRVKAIELFCQAVCGDSCPETSFRCCEKRAKFVEGLNK